jgi:23S rRNA pseudouridine2605 synthase
VWLTFAIREGKNREVRKVLESLGLKVNRLIRVSYGPLELGDLDEGAVAEVETEALRKTLGPEIVAQAECDFESPIEDVAALRRHEGRGKRGGRGESGGQPSVADRRPHRQDDEERPERPRPVKKPRRDRRGGPRPSRPRPK